MNGPLLLAPLSLVWQTGNPGRDVENALVFGRRFSGQYGVGCFVPSLNPGHGGYWEINYQDSSCSIHEPAGQILCWAELPEDPRKAPAPSAAQPQPAPTSGPGSRVVFPVAFDMVALADSALIAVHRFPADNNDGWNRAAYASELLGLIRGLAAEVHGMQGLVSEIEIMNSEIPIPFLDGDLELLDFSNVSPSIKAQFGELNRRIGKDLIARAEAGLKKYGTTLQTHNGRDAKMDLYQELLDAWMYLTQHGLERNDQINVEFLKLQPPTSKGT